MKYRALSTVTGLGIGLLLVSTAASVSAAGLVPCEGLNCTPCHFFALAQNISNFIAKDLIPPLAVLLITIGGVMYFISAGSEERRTQAKGILTWAIIGLVLAYASFLILYTFLSVLAGGSPTAVFQVTKTGFQIGCEVPARPPTPTIPPEETQPPGPQPGPVSPEIQAAAARACTSETQCKLDGSCMDVSPRKNINELMAGKQMTRCSNGCTVTSGCGADIENGFVTPSLDMLNAIPNIKDVGCGNYTITSIAGGSHSPSSVHYEGKGVDIAPTGRTIDWQICRDGIWAARAEKTKGVTAVRCEFNGTEVNCRTGGPNHIHVTF